MATIDLVLSGKGGSGKSFIAWVLSQYRIESGNKTDIIDIDPVNDTLNQFSGLNCKLIDIIVDGLIDKKRFDQLITTIISSTAKHIVVDTGSGNYLELMHYLNENDVPENLSEMGHIFNIHIVVTGGPAMHDTLLGLKSIMETFDSESINFILWENEYFGPVKRENQSFTDMKVYKHNLERLNAHIKIEKLDHHTSQADLLELLSKRLTFEQGIVSDSFTWPEQNRLKKLRKNYFGLLTQAEV